MDRDADMAGDMEEDFRSWMLSEEEKQRELKKTKRKAVVLDELPEPMVENFEEV